MSVQARVTRRHLEAATLIAALGDASPWYDTVDEVPYEYTVEGFEDDDVEARLLEQRTDEYIRAEDPDGTELAKLQAERERFEAERSERLAAVRAQVEQSPVATCWVRMGVPISRMTPAVLGQCAMALHVLACDHALFVERPSLDAFLCTPALCDASLAVVAARSTSRALTAERSSTVFVMHVKARDALPFLADMTTAVVIGQDARRSDPGALLAESAFNQAVEAEIPAQHRRVVYLKRVYDVLLVGVCAFLASAEPVCDDAARPLVLGWCKAVDRLVRPLLRAYAERARAACSLRVRTETDSVLGEQDPVQLARFLGSRTSTPWLADTGQQQKDLETLVRTEHETVWLPLLERVQKSLREAKSTCLFEGQWADYFNAGAVRPSNVSFVSLLSLGWIAIALSTRTFEQCTRHTAQSVISFDNSPIPD